MPLNLRKRTPINYYEPEEPAFDEYIYCEECSDFVYEYCSIHGPLLIIPDEKVPIKPQFPSYVPRAALTIPRVFLHLAPSIIPGAGLGVFSTLTLPRGVRFGPYRGLKTQHVDSMYCWQIYDRERKPVHAVDAGDAGRSNWMRYVNCARHCREQNLVAYQYQGQLYYRTIRTIPRFTELMVFYGGEFANKLHINLSKYNTDSSYQDVIGTITHVIEISEVTADTDIKNDAEHFEMTASGFSDEKFEFIDEEIGEDCEKTNVTCIVSNNVDSKQSVFFGTKTVTYESGKLIIKFNNDLCSIHKCNICGRSFASKKNLRNHVRIHSLVQVFECPECNFTTKHIKSLNRHVSTHRKVVIEDDACTKNNRIENKSMYVKERKCGFCDFTTVSRKKLSIHVAKHKGNVFKCDLCHYSSYCKFYLVKHIRRHKL